MHCLVLGGLGFIGSHIVDALVAGGHEVTVFDLPNVTTKNLKQCLDGVRIVSGDFKNVRDLSVAMEGIDIVIHLVGTTVPGPSNENPIYDVESNIIGTLKLLQKAIQKKVKKIIFASSGGTVYGVAQKIPIPETHQTNPICSYGITKLAIEKYLALYNQLYGLNYVVLRAGNAYGVRQRINGVQGAVAVFLGKVFRNESITIWGDGSVARDYVYVSDLVAAFMRVIDLDANSKIFNIGSGHAYSINEILSVIRDVTGRKPRVEFAPNRKLDVPINCLDIRRAEVELGWKPQIPIKEGISRTWKWLTNSM
jgi:UDP-glucose 4-epimerase